MAARGRGSARRARGHSPHLSERRAHDPAFYLVKDAFRRGYSSPSDIGDELSGMNCRTSGQKVRRVSPWTACPGGAEGAPGLPLDCLPWKCTGSPPELLALEVHSGRPIVVHGPRGRKRSALSPSWLPGGGAGASAGKAVVGNGSGQGTGGGTGLDVGGLPADLRGNSANRGEESPRRCWLGAQGWRGD